MRTIPINQLDATTKQTLVNIVEPYTNPGETIDFNTAVTWDQQNQKFWITIRPSQEKIGIAFQTDSVDYQALCVALSLSIASPAATTQSHVAAHTTIKFGDYQKLFAINNNSDFLATVDYWKTTPSKTSAASWNFDVPTKNTAQEAAQQQVMQRIRSLQQSAVATPQPYVPHTPQTIWGTKGAENILRKTILFGVLPQAQDPKNGLTVMVPTPYHQSMLNRYGLISSSMVGQGQEAHSYYPDILNDLQLTDHYPLLQTTKIGAICTLNLMKQCAHAGSYYNNAFNKEETPQQYKVRLDMLADLIICIIKEQGVVLFSFQEAPDANTEPGKSFFYTKIKNQTGYEFATNQSTNGLATLYNPRKFTLTPSSNYDQSIRAETIMFQQKDAQNKTLYVTNAHVPLAAASQCVARMATNMQVANTTTPKSNHDHIWQCDSNLCINETAVSGLGNNNNAATAARTAAREAWGILDKNNMLGAVSFVEGTLLAKSKNGVTTADMCVCSQSLNPSVQLPLYEKQLPAGQLTFQEKIERERKNNVATFQIGVAGLMSGTVNIAIVNPAPPPQPVAPTSPSAAYVPYVSQPSAFDPRAQELGFTQTRQQVVVVPPPAIPHTSQSQPANTTVQSATAVPPQTYAASQAKPPACLIKPEANPKNGTSDRLKLTNHANKLMAKHGHDTDKTKYDAIKAAHTLLTQIGSGEQMGTLPLLTQSDTDAYVAATTNEKLSMCCAHTDPKLSLFGFRKTATQELLETVDGLLQKHYPTIFRDIQQKREKQNLVGAATANATPRQKGPGG